MEHPDWITTRHPLIVKELRRMMAQLLSLAAPIPHGAHEAREQEAALCQYLHAITCTAAMKEPTSSQCTAAVAELN